ncbi:SPW_0924 family protein [Streptomyces sp. NPDC052236]
MRALVAAAIGLAAAFAFVLAITWLGGALLSGETSPEPLLTTVPTPKK